MQCFHFSLGLDHRIVFTLRIKKDLIFGEKEEFFLDSLFQRCPVYFSSFDFISQQRFGFFHRFQDSEFHVRLYSKFNKNFDSFALKLIFSFNHNQNLFNEQDADQREGF